MNNVLRFVTSRQKLRPAAFFLILLFSFVPNQKKIKVYLTGDSTMAFYDKTRFPQAGWGMPFANYFDSTVIVENRAKGGRSSKSFMSEGFWKPIVDNLQEGDFVLIQFGHNDAANAADHPNRYASPEEYKSNLIIYVTETRARKANPVLITPVTRLKFDANGKAEQSHAPFSKMVADVAAQYKVPLIDLDTKSRELVQKLGQEFSKYMYLDLEPGEEPFYPSGIHDNTHFSEFGARKMAEIALHEISALKLELANHIVKPNVTSR